MKYGSLFSGIGGFDLGFDRAGMRCAYQVERDARAIGVLERHWTAYDAHGRPLSDSARQWLTGNAVSVPVAHWLGARIVRAYRQ